MKRTAYIIVTVIVGIVMVVLMLAGCSTCISFDSDRECRCMDRQQNTVQTVPWFRDDYDDGVLRLPIDTTDAQRPYWQGDYLVLPCPPPDTMTWRPHPSYEVIENDTLWLRNARRDLDEMRYLRRTAERFAKGKQ